MFNNLISILWLNIFKDKSLRPLKLAIMKIYIHQNIIKIHLTLANSKVPNSLIKFDFIK